MPFNNPVVGAINLIRSAIRSPNYVAATSGWTINRDGTAEFSSISLNSGNPSGGHVIIDGNGIRVYDFLGALMFQVDSQTLPGHESNPVVCNGADPTSGPC